jgi:hypothetical protein
LTAEEFAEANDVTVRIYSAADNYLVYEQTVPRELFRLSRSTYIYTNRIRAGQPGGITSLRFDVGRNKFNLRAAKVNLTGLSCPLYVLINLGTYTGLGIAEENIVNGRRLIPIRFMSGYADTLAVIKSRIRLVPTSSGDLLSLKGIFTVADDSSVTNGLTITWDGQTFTIPGGQFTQVTTNRWKCKYLSPDGSIIYADFNFPRCIFSIRIRQTNIVSQLDTVDFNLVFENYNKTVGVQL